jgi:hypothetical protein
VQEASINLGRAITGAGRIRDDRLLVDWSSDGAGVETVIDTFSRTVTANWGYVEKITHSVDGDLSLFWNLNGDGGSVADSDWDVAAGVATHEIPAAPAYRMSLLVGRTYADENFTAEFKCPAATGANLEAEFLVGGTTAQTYLLARAGMDTAGRFTLLIVERDDGSETTLGFTTVTHTVHDADTWYAIRLQRFGARLRFRIWEAGTREPLERWDVSATYEGTIGAGFAGVKSGAANGNTNTKPVTISWRNLRLVNGTFDDMSRQLGAWTVDHHLDDGMPSEVSFVSGTAVPTLRADVMRPGWVSGCGRYTNREYFSPFNDDSPIAGFDRDVPPTTLEAGVVTEAGREHLPVFTGTMQNLRMRGGEVTLEAISQARLKLGKLVQPPAVYGPYEGANATWVVSYVLAACEVYASPPPQDGCRLWMPMHGSLHPFLPATNQPQVNTSLVLVVDGSTVTGRQKVVDAPWIDGPFVAAPDLGEDQDGNIRAFIDNLETGDGLPLADGDDLFSQAGNLAKVEMWVKCDPHQDTGDTLGRFFLVCPNGTFVDLGISGISRRPFITVDDGPTSNTFFHSTGLPDDGEWRLVGWAWDIANSKRWITIDDDTESDTTAFSTAGLEATDNFNDIDPRLRIRIPFAEFQVTSGATANPDNFPWLHQIEFTPGAQVVRSSMNLASIAERTPREAWEILTALGLSELAMLRIDETDIVRYLGFTHWGKAAQQSIVDYLDTAKNLGALDVNIDPTKIRNAITVTFPESFNVNLFSSAMSVQDVYTIPPGISILTIPTDAAIAEIRGFDFDYIEDADTVEPSSSNFVSLNNADDGTGFYATSASVTVTVVRWDPGSVTIQFDNTTITTWYTANDKAFATINVAGKLLVSKQASNTEYDHDSIELRGERGLVVNLPAIQRMLDARRVAKRIRNALATPVVTVERVSLRGDQRRQPGDLVSIQDSETGVEGHWRLHSVLHEDDGELYTQEATFRKVRTTSVWGTAKWGQNVWGETPV